MLLRFKKGKGGPGTLSCLRADGSSSYTKLHPDIELHDIIHYVVETELGFNNAFYGLVASGFDIDDFALPRDQRPKALMPANLPLEAHQAEHLVNLIQIDMSDAQDPNDFLKMAEEIFRDKDIDFPRQLTPESLVKIHTRLRELQFRWNSIGEGELLELEFPHDD
ncbi:MAG: hypothetical protein AB3N14_08000 [Flavobacteriaceae bacterium]